MPPVTGFRSVASSNIGTFNTENYFKLLLNIERESEMKDYLCSLSIGYDQLCNIYTRWWLRACITTNYSIRFPRDRDKKYIIMQSINLISFHGTGAIVSHMKFTSYSREKDARTNLTWQWEYFTWNLCYIQVNIKHVNNILSM